MSCPTKRIEPSSTRWILAEKNGDKEGQDTGEKEESIDPSESSLRRQ
jgi:hypothetical protein